MAIHDCTSQRLYIDAPLGVGAETACTPEQANYLLNVLRLTGGAEILVFNGRDGEWRAAVLASGKRGAALRILGRVREQADGPDIDYVFAPLKRARLDYMVQKAVEMGVARLCPVITRRTIAERVNLDRMKANAIEAAEQCGVLRIPEVAEPQKIEKLIASWSPLRPLVFCDEGAEAVNPIAVLKARLGPQGAGQGIGVLVGPEGGFAREERDLLYAQPFTVAVLLGPRIMRADTAAVAALALVNAVGGDW